MSELADSLDLGAAQRPDRADDERVYRACQRFGELDAPQQHAVRQEMSKDRSWVLIGWAEAMATLAVREDSLDRVVYGMVGLSLVNAAEVDQRDGLAVLRLLVRAATLLGHEPDGVRADAAARTDRLGAKWILTHSPPTSRVAAIWEEVGEGRNFAFRREFREWNPDLDFTEPYGPGNS